MKKNIAIIYAFDDTGATACEKILGHVGKKYRHDFSVKKIGIDETDRSSAQMDRIMKVCLSSDAVIVASTPSSLPDKNAAFFLERLILGVRNTLKLYTNIVPIISYDDEKRYDILCVMDAAGGIYHGEKGIRRGKLGREAYDTECYSEIEIERVARIAFELAATRERKVLSVDKAELLSSSELWRTAIHDVASDYPDITLDDSSVEDAVRQAVTHPDELDVIVTTNLFGDILAALLARLSGAEDHLPTCFTNDTTLGLYLPYVGKETVLKGYNSPVPAIMAAASALRFSFELYDEYACVANAVESVLRGKFRTPDVAGKDDIVCSAERIIEEVLKLL